MVSIAKLDQNYVKMFGQIKQGVELRVAFKMGVSGVCSGEMVELSGLVELPVVELSRADCPKRLQ